MLELRGLLESETNLVTDRPVRLGGLIAAGSLRVSAPSISLRGEVCGAGSMYLQARDSLVHEAGSHLRLHGALQATSKGELRVHASARVTVGQAF